MQKLDIPFDAHSTSYLTCHRKYQARVIFGIGSAGFGGSIFTQTGKLIHKYAERWAKWNNPAYDDMPAPVRDVMRTTEAIPVDGWGQSASELRPELRKPLMAFGMYLASVPPALRCSDPEQPLGVEHKFWFPMAETSSIIFHACGTIDKIENHQNSFTVVRDWKSMGKQDSQMADKYALGFQLDFYMHVLDRYLRPLFPDMKENLYGMISTIEYNMDPPYIRDSALTPCNNEMTESLIQKCFEDITRIVELGDTLAKPTGKLSDACHRCSLRLICSTHSEENLRQHYATSPKVPYNPLSHTD
jgi:hypothetical protein